MRVSFKCLIVFLTISSIGCSYRHYLGLHGPSIKSYPDLHAGVTEDWECLQCHHPDKSPKGPATSHPEFTGCIKCHNDTLMKTK